MNNIQKHFKHKAECGLRAYALGGIPGVIDASGSQNENHNHAYQERT